LNLEKLLCNPDGFGLVTASPLQRAICRVASGQPLLDLESHPDVVAAMGDVRHLRGIVPAELLLLCAIRSGKSLFASALAVYASQTCDVSGLRKGEVPRFSIVSTRKDLADVVLDDHLVGTLQSRPALRALLMSEPKADTVLLRHPTGRPVEIKVVAGARAGATLVARWSAGVVFDEASRMVGASEGVVNLDDARKAIAGRMLPGAQIVNAGSPWAPAGPVYEMTSEHWLKPSRRLVVVRAPGPAMNPVWWTEERCRELEATDPDAYRTDVLAEFADPESSLLAADEIAAVTRAAPLVLGYVPGQHYRAEMDPATRGNAWALVVLTTRRDAAQRELAVVALAKQWIGSSSKPLSPRVVLQEIAVILQGYGLKQAGTDQWSADANRDIARDYGLELYDEAVTHADNVRAFMDLRTMVADRLVELPPDPVVRSDLLSIRKRVTQAGLAIDLPKTSDGRHADYAAALARGLQHYVAAPALPRPVAAPRDSVDRFKAREEREFAEAERRARSTGREVPRQASWLTRKRRVA
jgi:hypothetical protein